MPDIVKEYLTTSNEELRTDAYHAADSIYHAANSVTNSAFFAAKIAFNSFISQLWFADIHNLGDYDTWTTEFKILLRLQNA